MEGWSSPIDLFTSVNCCLSMFNKYGFEQKYNPRGIAYGADVLLHSDCFFYPQADNNLSTYFGRILSRPRANVSDIIGVFTFDGRLLDAVMLRWHCDATLMARRDTDHADILHSGKQNTFNTTETKLAMCCLPKLVIMFI